MGKYNKKPNQQMRLTLILGSVVLLFLFFNLLSKQPEPVDKIDYTEFMSATQLEEGDPNRIAKVTFQENQISGERSDGSKFTSYGPTDADVRRELLDRGITVDFKPPEQASWLKEVFIHSLPIIFMILIVIFILRQLQIGGGKAMSFGKSRARLAKEGDTKVTFKDVAGIEEAKEELEEIIDFLKDPGKFTNLGGRIPKGVLLVGPPGTGKTILAKAVAGEAGVPFFSISGSDFVEMFVGVGASRVRDLFEQAKKNSPCIVFIDEIDAVGRHRGAGLGGGHDEREQTLNQLLVEMDGFEPNEGVILIAATNRADVLDPALLRPGRFDRRVMVSTPDLNGREQILKVHSRKTPLSEDVELHRIAQGTPGFSGADLENLVNEAALIAARLDEKVVRNEHFELAKDKVLMGPKRKSLILNEKEKRTTAYHEAGHALVARLIPDTDPVHKISVIPRGMALGVTILLPEEDKTSISRDQARATIAYAMGGRAAEELVFGHHTTGASDDIKKATQIARRMVCEWGMSDKIGPLYFSNTNTDPFVGKSMGNNTSYSERMSELIDEEIKTIVDEGYQVAIKQLTENRPILEKLAEALVIKETIDRRQLDLLLEGKEILTEKDIKDYEENKKRQEELREQLKKGKPILPEEKKEETKDDGVPVGLGQAPSSS